MGRAPCCSKVGLHRGPWTPNEDALLTKYVQENGEGNWRSVPKKAGLLRCGKSCRLRWMNYLRPDIKRGSIEPEEEELIIRLHARLGNRWSLIAAFLPGRTDNGIKNYWNTHLSKKLKRQQMHQKVASIHQLVDGQPTSKINNIHEEPQQPPKKKKKKRKSIVRNMPKMMMMQKGKMKMDQPNDEEVASGSSDNGFEGGINAAAGDGLDFASSWTGFGSQSTVGLDESHDFSVPHHYSQTATKDAMLEEVYQEYLQLLETDRKPALQFDPIQEFVWA